MQYAMFGNTGMQTSRLALGTMTFGQRLDTDETRQVIDQALDAGVNLLDTADSYGPSEEVLGQILSQDGRRERVYLATKVFRRFCRDKKVARNSRVNILSSLEHSLKLLKTDYVDLYQLHHPDELTPIDETLAVLEQIIRQGKVRYVGVSNHYAWQMAYMLGRQDAQRLNPIVSYQANYNILDRQIEREATPFLKRFNMALMCYGPLCGGILTGKYHDEQGEPRFPDGSRGAKAKKMQHYVEDETVQQVVTELRGLAQEQDLSLNQLATLWLLAKPYVTTVLMGGTRIEHFQQILEVADRELPEEVVQRIDDLSAPRVDTHYMNQPMAAGARLEGQHQ